MRYLRPIGVLMPGRRLSRSPLIRSYGNGLTSVIYAGSVAPAPVTIEIPPEADSFVQSYYPNNNYGTLTYWGVGVSQAPNIARAFLRFPLTAIPSGKTINYAKLCQYVWQIWGTIPYQRRYDLHFVPTDTWGETTITYNNQPPPGAVLIYNTQIAAVGWYNYDITDQVRIEYQGDGKISLRWRDNPENTNYWEGYYAYSKEYSDPNYRPFLRVEYV